MSQQPPPPGGTPPAQPYPPQPPPPPQPQPYPPQAPAQPYPPQAPTQPYPQQPAGQPYVPQPGAPGAPPPGWGPPTVQGWGGAPAPKANKKGPIFIVVAVVVIIGLIGGGFALLNAGKDEEKPGPSNNDTDEPTAVDVLGPGADPDAGPAPEEPEPDVSPPGPETEDPVEPDEPDEPDEPVEPDEPPVEPDEPPVEPVNTGDVVDVGAGVTVALADGWDVASNDGDGLVDLQTDGAFFRVILQSMEEGEDANTLMQLWVDNFLNNELADWTITSAQDINPPVSSVFHAAAIEFSGYFATNQGSVPVEGLAIAMVRQDGLGVIIDVLNAEGQYEAYSADYDAMFSSVLDSL